MPCCSIIPELHGQLVPKSTTRWQFVFQTLERHLQIDSLTAFFNHSFILLALSLSGVSGVFIHNVSNSVLFMHGFLTSALIHTALLKCRYLENDPYLCLVHVIWTERRMLKLMQNVKYLLLLSFLTAAKINNLGNIQGIIRMQQHNFQ